MQVENIFALEVFKFSSGGHTLVAKTLKPIKKKQKNLILNWKCCTIFILKKF